MSPGGLQSLYNADEVPKTLHTPPQPCTLSQSNKPWQFLMPKDSVVPHDSGAPLIKTLSMKADVRRSIGLRMGGKGRSSGETALHAQQVREAQTRLRGVMFVES